MTWIVRPMTSGDIGSGMALKTQAGWNQVEADWQRLLRLEPDGGFVAEQNGRVVGTVIANAFGPVGWIAMMLVEETMRGRGIGRALMIRALEFLRDAGARSIRLDATPMGRPLYESLGFVEDAEILRLEGTPNRAATDPATRPATSADLEAMITLDRQATATDRARLLAILLNSASRVFPKSGTIDGFCMTRPGSRCPQIGPCIGSNRAGPPLLSAAFRALSGSSILIDIPASHRGALEFAESAGLSITRRLSRMTLGEPIAERRELLWASSGPENG